MNGRTRIVLPSTLFLALVVLLYRVDNAASFVNPTTVSVSMRSLQSATLSNKNTLKAPPSLSLGVAGSSSDDNDFSIPLEMGASGAVSPETIDDSEESDGLGIWGARALLMLIAVIWGTNFAAVKYLETLCFHPPCVHLPSEAAFARFGVAALVSLPLLIGQRKDIILGGFECGLWITIGYISQAIALGSISAGKCAFICSLTVVVVPLISAAFYGKPLKPMHVIAAAVALSGVGILEGMVDFNALLGVQPALAEGTTAVATAATSTAAATVSAMDPGTSITSASTAATAAAASAGPLGQIAKSLGVGKGDLIALGQPLGFGYTFIRIEHYVEKFKDVKNNVLTLSAAQCVTVGALSLFWVLYDFHGTLPSFEYMLDPHRLAAIGWTGIITTVVAIYLEGIALKTATATDAALTFSSEPVWASMFGFLLLHEHLGVNSYVGGAVILAACVLGAMSDMSEEQPEALEAEEDYIPVDAVTQKD